MERGDVSDSERAALDLIRDIRKIERNPIVSAKLDELARALEVSKQHGPGGVKPRRQYGAFAGKFSIGPEFFEPMSEEERRAWGEV